MNLIEEVQEARRQATAIAERVGALEMAMARHVREHDTGETMAEVEGTANGAWLTPRVVPWTDPLNSRAPLGSLDRFQERLREEGARVAAMEAELEQTRQERDEERHSAAFWKEQHRLLDESLKRRQNMHTDHGPGENR